MKIGDLYYSNFIKDYVVVYYINIDSFHLYSFSRKVLIPCMKDDYRFKNGEFRKASELETLLFGGDLETNTTPKRR